ncbi:MAG: NTP transferase domain-containing protein [Candidatus Omnitrophica bacterium]|nr:NTP transferase domain-containing protein [Candidatus Omnitrophota bacterium]
MKIVILCGGKGLRMGSESEIPKPMALVGDKPILWHVMKQYAHFGFNDFVLCLGFKGSVIKKYFEENNHANWNITFVDTGLDTNTGGRIKKIQDYVQDENFMATYSDGVADINLKALNIFHLKHGLTATITAVKPFSQFGEMLLDQNDVVTEFKEKPRLQHWINGGFFVFKQSFFDYLNEDCVLEKEPFEHLARERQIVAFQLDGFWKCMDTYKDRMVLNELWKSGKAEWKKW